MYILIETTMKKIKYLLLLLIGVSATSCKDYLEVNPNLGFSADEVYSDFTTMMSAVDRATNLVENYFRYIHFAEWCHIGSMADEMQLMEPTCSTLGHTVNAGLWQDNLSHDFGFGYGSEDSISRTYSWSGGDAPAGRAVVAIRALNLCEEGYLEYGEDMTFPDESLYSEEEMRGQILGQIYFLRAYHYFQLIIRYGGMPNMRTILAADYDFDQSRPTFKESADWCVEDLDLAIQYLPEAYTASYDIGRPTISSAKALKAQVLLYAASPLMNDTYPYTAAATYDEDYLKRAVEASIVAIESIESGRNRYAMYSWYDYKENFNPYGTELTNEAVFQPAFVQSKLSSGTYWQNIGGYWYNSLQYHGSVDNRIILPTHNAALWHGTVDGYSWEDRAKSKYADLLEENPFDVNGRDPRMKHNMFCHGDDMYTASTVDHIMDCTRTGTIRVDTEALGLIFTGYVSAKYLWPGQVNNSAAYTSSSGTGTRQYGRVLAPIRVPQLYLDFAEAANELYGPTGEVPGCSGISVSTAAEAVNKIRARVGGEWVYRDLAALVWHPQLEDLPTEYTSDKDKFREAYRRERAVELFQEFHRWFDIRRWKIAVDLFADSNNCIQALDMYEENGEMVYASKSLSSYGVKRVFEAKHYWYPFSNTDMNKLGTFEQNPGW